MNRRHIVAITVFTILSATAPAVRADVTKSQCIDANTSAQSMRRDGKIANSRVALAICSDPQCPALVRDDCTRQLDAVELVQPSIIFDAKDAAGADVGAVHVTVDGRPLAQTLDGTPLRVDPGPHEFTFEADDMVSSTQVLVLKESEKGRRERVTLVRRAAGGGSKREVQTEAGGQRNLGLLLGGVGTAALVVGGLFGVLASSKWSTTKGECSGPDDCPSYSQAVSDHRATVTNATVSTIGFIAGGALLTAGAVLFFTGSPPTTGIAPAVSPGSAALTFTGRFQ